MRTNEQIVNKLYELKEQQGLSLSELARRVGMAKSALSRYFNRTREFPLNRIDTFAKALGTTANELLGIDSDSTITTIYSQLHADRQKKVYDFASDQLTEQNKVVSLAETHPKPKYAVPWYGAASAGTGEFLMDDQNEDVWLEEDQIPTEADFCLTVNGNSMEPIFPDQSYIFVREQENLNSGEIGVVIVNSEAFVKRVWFEGDCARLESFNKDYEDRMVELSDDFKVIGKVVL